MRFLIQKSVKGLVILLMLSSFGSCSPSTGLPVGAKPLPVMVPEPISTDMPLMISLYPPLAAVERDIRITCRLPTNVGDGQFIFGLTGMFSSEGPIDRRVYSRIITMPCQPIHVYCGYKEHGKELKIISQDFEPIGDCKDARNQR